VWQFNWNKEMKVVFCDVGQGDGALIIKGSFQMLVDVGGDNQKMLGCLSRHLPFWDKTIEAVVVSHWDTDHSGGLAGIYRYYTIEKLYANQSPPPTNEQKFYPTKVGLNDVIRFGEIDFEILNGLVEDGDQNENSLVGLLRYRDLPTEGQVKILMMGDTTSEVEQRLVWQGSLKMALMDGGVDVLKVSHHGSDRATSEELLDEIKPKMAIISVGKNNKFGHPAKEVLEKLERRGISVRRTDVEGDVLVTHTIL